MMKIFQRFIMVVLTLGFGLVSFAQAANPTVYFQSSKTSMGVGEEITVSVMMDTKDLTVSAAELHINFPKDLLRAKSIKTGTFLPVELMKGKIGDGNLSITLGSQPSDPKKGSGTLATVVFKALKVGKAEFSFASNTRVAAIGKTGNVLSSSLPLAVEIKSAVTQTTGQVTVPDDNPNQTQDQDLTQTQTENQQGFWGRLWGGIKSFFSKIF